MNHHKLDLQNCLEIFEKKPVIKKQGSNGNVTDIEYNISVTFPAHAYTCSCLHALLACHSRSALCPLYPSLSGEI